MNKMTQAIEKEENETVTQNGMMIKKSSQDALVDLFYAIGGLRNDPARAIELFQKAFKANKQLSVRIALYARDVRGGMGERNLFRLMMQWLASNDHKNAIKMMHIISEVGRWDDMFAFLYTPVEKEALSYLAKNIENPLCAKWMPREKSTKKAWALKLRNHMGLSAREYRKLLVGATDVVEQKMSAKQWNNIEFSHVPSLASARYQKAFYRNAPANYGEYINALETGEEGVKINAGAVYPYDVIKSVAMGEHRVAEQQWKALPNYIEDDKSFIPLIDVSGSMTQMLGNNPNLCVQDVAMSLGIYCAQRNRSAFKDKFLTFANVPNWVDIGGLDLKEAVNKTRRAPWDMNTNFELAMKLIVDTAVRSNVPKKDMPDYLIVFSDMQFDIAKTHKNKPHGMSRQMFEDAGYDMPIMVYWNLSDYGANTPVSFDKDGTMLVSGFSPSIMKSIMAMDLDNITPYALMLKAIMIDRYNWKQKNYVNKA
jgi:hypothetical protein